VCACSHWQDIKWHICWCCNEHIAIEDVLVALLIYQEGLNEDLLVVLINIVLKPGTYILIEVLYMLSGQSD
jgi:hypothetical protein